MSEELIVEAGKCCIICKAEVCDGISVAPNSLRFKKKKWSSGRRDGCSERRQKQQGGRALFVLQRKALDEFVLL